MKLITIYDPTERPLGQRLRIAHAIITGQVHIFLRYCVGWHYEGRLLPPKEIRLWVKQLYPDFQCYLTEPKANGKPAIVIHKTVSYQHLKQTVQKRRKQN